MNDITSMERIYRDNYKNVYYQVLSFIKNRETALDLTQDIFLKAMEQFDKFRGQSALSTWLYAIAKNHCLEYIRKSKFHFCEISANENQIVSEEYDQEEGSAFENKYHWIEQSLKNANDPGIEILFLKHKKNYSVKEIQNYLHLTESAVKMRLQRARRQIASSYFSHNNAA